MAEFIVPMQAMSVIRGEESTGWWRALAEGTSATLSSGDWRPQVLAVASIPRVVLPDTPSSQEHRISFLWTPAWPYLSALETVGEERWMWNQRNLCCHSWFRAQTVQQNSMVLIPPWLLTNCKNDYAHPSASWGFGCKTSGMPLSQTLKSFIWNGIEFPYSLYMSPCIL